MGRLSRVARKDLAKETSDMMAFWKLAYSVSFSVKYARFARMYW